MADEPTIIPAPPDLAPLLLLTRDEPWPQWYAETRLLLADWLDDAGREGDAEAVRGEGLTIAAPPDFRGLRVAAFGVAATGGPQEWLALVGDGDRRLWHCGPHTTPPGGFMQFSRDDWRWPEYADFVLTLREPLAPSVRPALVAQAVGGRPGPAWAEDFTAGRIRRDCRRRVLARFAGYYVEATASVPGHPKSHHAGHVEPQGLYWVMRPEGCGEIEAEYDSVADVTHYRQAAPADVLVPPEELSHTFGDPDAPGPQGLINAAPLSGKGGRLSINGGPALEVNAWSVNPSAAAPRVGATARQRNAAVLTAGLRQRQVRKRRGRR